MPVKRKSLSPKVREAVYYKYDGHCAYCGKKLNTKEFQVDHLIPVQRERFGKYTEDQLERFDNYMPTCRRCNHYKRAHSLETFRRYIEEDIIMVNGAVKRKEKVAYKNLKDLRELISPFTFFYYPKIKLNFHNHVVRLKDYTEYDEICRGVLTPNEQARVDKGKSK